MISKNTLILAFVFILLVITATSIFTVSETERALLLEFKKIVRTDFEPGLHFKLPYQEVKKYDDRILTLESKPERFLTSEKKNVIVTWFVKWRIEDATKFYKAVGGDKAAANIRLDQITKDALRNEFSKRTIREVVSLERGQIRDLLIKTVNPVVDDLGVEVIDIRVKGIDLPDEVSSSVYRRMEAERARVARDFRSRGAEAAERIRAEADRQREVILADAYRDSEIRRGEGDATASEIYAQAYSRNPEFFEFYRSLYAYRQVFKDENDMIVLEPDSKFFQYFKKPK
ncbi:MULTISPECIES: protease modulator HflC [unclassified Methylocaldum]|jgi:membrane protease subunit HflC|uniref:protease modulator HflC n=1 Tax=unclassified Methylocaldum TaxID=2622260 RepID=UPI000A321E8B|nr:MULTISPECIES: protease modulator HflC [unclassified Methylocaldum]MBP1149941.1 membrane protease subunit HflC [Methylocaldum sp. RMAD-M]MVF21142.1 protease modulator HflC [Methylocaldum sp. BRCS4]